MSKKSVIGGSLPLPCTCTHPDQDRRYGAGNRVHNLGPKASPGKTAGARCTVCGRSKAL